MENNIEYNFTILEYSCKDNILLSFRYDLSVYYKDNTPGYYNEQNEYVINRENVKVSDIQDIINVLFEIENVDNFTRLSFVKDSIEKLKIKTDLCSGGNWSINNISKYE